MPTCKLIIFSPDPCSKRNNCWVSWNSGTPPRKSLSLASLQCLRSTGGAEPIPCKFIHSPKSHPQLQRSCPTKHQSDPELPWNHTNRPAWGVCRVTHIGSLHFLFLNETLWLPNPKLEPAPQRVKLQLKHANRKFLCKVASAVTCEMRCKQQLQLFTN